jgi:predicted TIM-barrel fold metal-dependent hydrolase
VEKRGADEASSLTMRPSEYILGGRIFFGVECEEKTIPDGVRWGLEDTLLYASDYPHWDGDWPHTVRAITKRTDLDESIKRKLLHDNALLFYGPRVEAGAAARVPVAEAR